MKSKKDARRTEAEEIARDAAIDQLLIDFSRWSESYKARWMTDDPRDILLWPDRTWCFREECGPELLNRGGYRVVKQNSFEWYSRARAPRPSRPE
jgi:hypothetical protein